MKPYPKYKDSGVEWIGKVPEGWEILPIKYVVKIPVTDGPHETPELLNEGIPFISAEAIKNDKIDFGKKRGFISIEEHKRFSKKYKPQKGDIYMIKSGATTGNIAVVETDDEFNIWSPLAVIRPDLKKTTTKFLFHFMKSINFFESIELGWSFGTQQNIGMGVIENLPIVAPSIEEQISIAAYLDRKTTQIDNLISKKQKFIELLKEERAAIINQAVTKGLNPDASMKDSGIEWLGEIPEHWEVKRLKFLVNKVGSGVTPRGGASVYQKDGIPLLRSQNIHFEGLKLDDVAYISEEIHNEMSGSKVKPNDVLLNITGASIGRCCIVPFDFGEANVNQHVCIIRPNRQIESGFLHNYISSDNGQAQIFSSEKGISREGLNFEQLKGFQVLLPPISDQKDIKDYIESATTKIDQTISNIEKQIDLLQEYRTALISEVVTGKIDVRT